MIKYCMRKSFKFAVDRLRKRETTRDHNSIVEYFQDGKMGHVPAHLEGDVRRR